MILLWLLLAVGGVVGTLVTLGIGWVKGLSSRLLGSSVELSGWGHLALGCSLTALVVGLAGIAVTQYRANRPD
jgi:hypothetical protein